jgi:hypothetical protein
MHWSAVERGWLPEWLHAREAVLDRLELAVADALWAADNGPQLKRVETMVLPALKDNPDTYDAESDLATPPLQPLTPSPVCSSVVPQPRLLPRWPGDLISLHTVGAVPRRLDWSPRRPPPPMRRPSCRGRHPQDRDDRGAHVRGHETRLEAEQVLGATLGRQVAQPPKSGDSEE